VFTLYFTFLITHYTQRFTAIVLVDRRLKNLYSSENSFKTKSNIGTCKHRLLKYEAICSLKLLFSLC